MQLAFREAFHPVTGVTEQDAAGAVAIHQHGDQLLTRGFSTLTIAVGSLQQRLDILFANQLAQSVQLLVGEVLARQQQGNGVGYRAVIVLLFDKEREVMEAVWIQQTQTRKVALQTQLFRGSGQQQHSRYALGQLFNRHVLTARRIFAPDQVMGFVDHHDVPLGVAQMLQALFATANKVQGADHQLFGFERVIRIVLGFGVALIVKQGETQVKAAQHLHQPLVLQGFRHHNQHALGCAGKQLLMQNHARFDGFT